MVGLLLIYFIGKYYYDLALQYSKNAWLYAVLGIAAYYLGTFFAGIVFGFISFFAQTDFFDKLPELVLSIFAIPFGVLSCFLVYIYLQKKWSTMDITDENSYSTDTDVE